MKCLFICYFLMLAFSSWTLVTGQILKFMDDTPEAIRDSKNVTKDWEKTETLLKRIADEGVKRMLPFLLDQSLNISSTCVRDATRVIAGMRRFKTWAMRFLDSSAKGIDGAITATIFSYGDYDECIDTVAIEERPGKHKGEELFTGKYCIVRVKPHLPPKKSHYENGEIIDELEDIYKRGTILSEIVKYAPLLYDHSIRLGLCVPSGCSVDDVNHLLSKVADYTRLYIKVKRCEVKEDPKYTPRMIFVMSLYSFVGFLVLLGTITEVYFYYSGKKQRSSPIRVLLAFSLMSNFRKLIHTSGSSKSLSCLNGIRSISMTWVVIGHSYGLLLIFRIVRELEYVLLVGPKNFAFQALNNAYVSVDTFFFLGGFLVCYFATKHVMIDKRKFNIIFFIFHRLWRIIPLYAFVILYVFIAERTISGPIAHESIKAFVEGCEDNWWTNLLFINNFYDTANICVPVTWYLSVDMQLYIASLIVLLPLFRWPKVGIGIAVMSLVISMVTCAVITYVKNVPPIYLSTDQHLEMLVKFGDVIHYKPYTHAGAYIIGLLTGYFLAMNPDIKIPKVIQLLGWTCAVTFGIAVVYGPYVWQRGRYPILWETLFFASCSRVAWASSIAWMVVCCATGHGGVVNYILSWKVWIPLGRLTYAAYLVHHLVEVSYLASRRNLVEANHADFTWLIFGYLMVTYGTAFVASMLVESPFASLEKLILKQRDEKVSNKTENDVKVETGMTEFAREVKHLSNYDLNVLETHSRPESTKFEKKV